MKRIYTFAALSLFSQEGRETENTSGACPVNYRITDYSGPKSRPSSRRYMFISAALFIMIFTVFPSLKLSGQTTYTWDGEAGDNSWGSAANWNPDRTTPATTDIILFNTGTVIEIVDVPNAHYITRMSVTDNTTVTLKPVTTLTIDGEIFVTAGDNYALYIESGSTLTIAGRDITGTDENILMFNLAASPSNVGATIEGTLRCGLDNNNLSAHGMIQRKGTTQLYNFMDGSVYEQAINGGYIPYGTWEEGSTCLITGITDFRPVFRPNDIYADVTWNCTSQTGVIDLVGNLRTIGGDFRVISTGTSSINFGQYVSSDLTIDGDYLQQGGIINIAPFETSSFSRKLTVRGDFTLSAGTIRICPRYSTGVVEIDGKFTSAGNFYFHQSGYNARATIDANGDCEISGGTFNMSSANSSLGVMNVKENFSHTGGTITETGLAGDIVFSGTEAQTFSSTGGTVSEIINFSVNEDSFLQMADAGTVVSGPGTFTLNTGAMLGIKSPLGIETSGSDGNIQTTNRYFNEGSYYVYSGISAQVTGSGLTQNIPAGLEINNSSGVTLSGATEISGLLNMTSGTLDLTNTSFTAGSLTGSSDITNSTGTPADVIVTIGSDGTSAPYSGVISNGTASSVALTKTGDGTTILSGTNTYTGPTTISGGVLELGSATTINDNSEIVLNGGTLSTGSGTGFSETAGALSLSASSIISLGSGSHTLNFAPTGNSGWQTGEVLTIYGWSGQVGSSGTEGKIIFGSDDTGLDLSLLGSINFYGYGSGGADILSTGEIVPHNEPLIAISSPDPAVQAGNFLQTTLNNVIYRLDISVTQGNAVITSIQATLSGTFLTTDLTNLKAWYSTDDSFTTEDILLSTIVSSGPGLHIFTPLTNPEILQGTTGYIFITADLPCEAIPGNILYVDAMTTNDITVISGVKSGTAYAGGDQTIAYGIPDNPVNPDASLAVNQTSLSWSDPACFDEIMIAGKEGSAVTTIPSGDGLSYTGDLAFGSGTMFDGGYIVYKGVTSPQTVTGLQNEVTYYFTFFSRRGTNWSTGATVSVTPVDNSDLTFRSAESGNWATASIWEMSYDNGLSWIQASVSPDSSYGPVTIRDGHSITVTSELYIDQTTIETGATVTSSAVLTIADDNPLGCEVYGTLQTITDGGTINANYGLLEFKDGGTYIHDRNGGSAPSATWSAGSNCNITGVTDAFTLTSLNQSLGNFTWNCPGQTVNLSIRGNLNDIKGNFSVVSTGTLDNFIRLGAVAAATLTVGGNYIQTGGIVSLTPDGQFTMSIAGDFTFSNGQINMSASSIANGVINVAGDFTHSGGILFENTTINPGGIVVFNGTGDPQTFTSGGEVYYTINYTVNSGAHLQMSGAATTITGGGTFTLSSGATLGITSADGITTTGGLTGNIRTTGGRVYSDEANYIYNGSVSQVSGNGLPLAVNSLLLSGTTDFTLTNGTAKNSPFTISQNLEIDAGSKMTVSPIQAVTVGTDLVNDGDLDLESDATGIASLMINGEYSGEGNAKSQIWMTGGDAGTEMWRWHYFAVPTQQSSESLAGVYGFDIMNYTDVTGMTDKSEGWSWYDGYEETTAFPNLNISEGYAYYNDDPVTMELNSDTLPSSLGTVNLNYGTFGWNLLGNSLTCGLNWDNVVFNGEVDHSVSFIKDYEEYYYVQSGPGVPEGTTGSIPPLQGFFVLALESGTSIDFSGAKEHNATAYYKGESGSNEKGNDLSVIRLSLANDELKDEMVVWFREEATMDYDYRFDAEKWYSEGSRPQIYSVLGGREFAINGIPLPETTAEIPLGLWIPEAGSYTVSLMELENIGDCDVYMKDLVNNTKTRLDQNYSYTFSAPAGAVNDRFIIAIENMTTGIDDREVSAKPFKVYDSFGFINIELLDESWEGLSGFVKIVDISGRTLIDSANETFSRTSLIRLPMGNRKGVFIVEIASFPGRYVTRVVIK